MTAPSAPGAVATEPAAEDLTLDVRDVTLRFGGVTSLDGVSLQHRRGEILAVIGPNGAGKTSLFNCLTGAYKPQEGSVRFSAAPGKSTQLLGRKPHVVTSLGIARTFQNIRLFPALTTLENVQVGVEVRHRTGPVGAVFGLPAARREERESVERSAELLDFVGLAHRADDVASALPYGEQRRLEIARALGTRPSLLLLDEPAAGTNPSEKRDLEALIRRIADGGTSVLLIEHDMRLVMSAAAEVVVLNFGRVIAAGTPARIQRDPAVIEAYLGTEAADDEAGRAEAETEAGGTPDHGAAPDGGARPDDGAGPDGGARPDGGAGPDGGALPDDGAGPDGGALPDDGAGPAAVADGSEAGR